MQETKTGNEKRNCLLNNEEKFFSLIEQRLSEQGYELLETSGKNQNAQIYQGSSRKYVHRNEDLDVQRDGLIGALEAVFAF